MTMNPTSKTATSDTPDVADSAAKALQSVLDKQILANPENATIGGIGSAVAAICLFIQAINDLQRVMSEKASALATLTSGYSDAENKQLGEDLGAIQAVQDATKDGGLALQKAQSQYSTHQTSYNNVQQGPQSMTSAWQSAVGNIGQATTTDFQNLGQLIAIFSHLAALLQ